jgi:hypothetical protein
VKKLYSLLVIFVCSALSTYSFSHGGGLNAQGCHNETATGEYHCHRSSYSPSKPVITSSFKSNTSSAPISSATQKVAGTFMTDVDEVVFKNVRCIDNNWEIDVINRTKNTKIMSYLFYTADSDGDPLATFKTTRALSGKSRDKITLTAFDCDNVPFDQLQYKIW